MTSSPERAGGAAAKVDELPPALRSMWRLCKLGYRHEPRLMVAAAIGDIRALIRRRGRWKHDRPGSSGRAAAYRFKRSCLVQTPIETRIERRGVEPRGQIDRRGKWPACRQSARESCGGARALTSGGKRLGRPKCSRMRAQAFRSVMNATTLIRAPQQAQRRISISKTRLRSAAQSSLEAGRIDEAFVVGPTSG